MMIMFFEQFPTPNLDRELLQLKFPSVGLKNNSVTFENGLNCSILLVSFPKVSDELFYRLSL